MNICITYFSRFGNNRACDPVRVKIHGVKGPLEEGWEQKIEDFAEQLTGSPA